MQIVPLALFAFSTTVTPGPNNMLVTANAARIGFRRTFPMILGVATGFPLMIAAIGLGVSGIMAVIPRLDDILRWVGFAWLLWMAWKIGNAPPPRLGEPPKRTLGYWGMVGFQWINPKAWLMSLAVTTAWIAPESSLVAQLAIIVGMFAAMTVPCMSAWALLGAAAGRLLGSPARLRAFNVVMAILLVASMLPVVLRR